MLKESAYKLSTRFIITFFILAVITSSWQAYLVRQENVNHSIFLQASQAIKQTSNQFVMASTVTWVKLGDYVYRSTKQPAYYL